jgi:hypothetical protein
VISPERRRYVAAGLRRFAKLSAGAAILVVLISLAMGLVFGHPVLRAITVGFYLTGSAVIILGFFHAHRGPLRPKSKSAEDDPFGRGPVRQATLAEREEALNASALFVSLGVVLFAIAVLLDSLAHSR